MRVGCSDAAAKCLLEALGLARHAGWRNAVKTTPANSNAAAARKKWKWGAADSVFDEEMLG